MMQEVLEGISRVVLLAILVMLVSNVWCAIKETRKVWKETNGTDRNG